MTGEDRLLDLDGIHHIDDIDATAACTATRRTQVPSQRRRLFSDGRPVQTSLMATSMLPRVALE
jgi:hypothetical protein